MNSHFETHVETTVSGRFLPPEKVSAWIGQLPPHVQVHDLGRSVEGRLIQAIEFGNGSKKVLGWSQMHGNESTTTKALMDLINGLTATTGVYPLLKACLDNYRFFFIPQLNPDGAAAYTRENAAGVDLNRDALALEQPESKALRAFFGQIQPDLCLNLHDQRSIYGFDNGKPAALSFLAPAADPKRSLTPSRRVAIRHIERMAGALSSLLPGMIGRYDDAYNPNCVGDTFQQLGVPTILFEAGHLEADYDRERARMHILQAYLVLFGLDDGVGKPVSYDLLPENRKNYCDVLVRNVVLAGRAGAVDLAIQYEERLLNGNLELVPIVAKIGQLDDYFGHRPVDGGGARVLVNSCENVFETEKVLTITEKNSPFREFFANS